MRARVFCLLCLLAAWVSPVFAQYFVQAVFHSDGPFTARCDGSGGLLSDETVVFIFHDWDRDGQDSTDDVFPPAFGIPEDPHAAFYTILLNEQGGFTSDTWFYGTGGTPVADIALYLRIFFGDSLDSCYTSALTVLPLDAATHQIDFPRNDWVCDSAPGPVPPCEMGGPGHTVCLNYYDPEYIEACPYVCPNSQLAVLANSGQITGLRPPVLEVMSECDSTGQPDTSVSFNPGLWENLDIHWLLDRVRASRWGFAKFVLLDSIPCGTLDTMTAESQQPGILLRWNTTRETNLDSFELWRCWAGSGKAGAVAASSSSSGDTYEFLDTGVAHVGGFGYNLVMVASDGRKYGAANVHLTRYVSADPGPAELPSGFALHPNYPNPFNPSTAITFDLPATARASLNVYDIAGREVSALADEVFSAGTHTVTFDGHGLPSGIYISRLTAGQFTASRKMILLK